MQRFGWERTPLAASAEAEVGRTGHVSRSRPLDGLRRALAGGGPVLDKPVRRRVQAAIDGLSEQPRPPGVLALQGLRRAYRLRVGDYRVIYTVDDGR